MKIQQVVQLKQRKVRWLAKLQALNFFFLHMSLGRGIFNQPEWRKVVATVKGKIASISCKTLR